MRKTALILLIVAAILGTGLWVAGRESTLLWAAQRVSAASDGRLEVRGLRGSLLGRIEAQHIRFRQNGSDLAVSDASLQWRPLALLGGTVSVARIAAESVEVSLTPSQREPTPPTSLDLPLRVAIDEIAVQRIEVRRNGSLHAFDRLSLNLDGARPWQLRLASLETPWGKLTGEVSLGPDASRAPLAGQFLLAARDEGAYSVAALLSGTLERPVLALTGTAQDARAQASAALTPFAAAPIERATLEAQNIDPRDFRAGAPHATLRLEAAARAGADGVLRGQARLENAIPGTLDREKLPLASLRGEFAVDGSAISLINLVFDLAAGGRLAGGGTLGPQGADIALRTEDLNLHALQSRLRETRLRGGVRATGDASQQQASLTLRDGEHRLALDAAYTQGRLALRRAQVSAGGGQLDASGTLELDAPRRFTFAANLRRFDPSRFGSYAPALINARADVRGELAPVLQLHSDIALDDSRLFGLPANVSGRLRSKGLATPDIALDLNGRIGETEASVQGVMVDPQRLRALDLTLRLAGGDMAQLYPIVGVPLPPTPPYSLEGRLTQHDQVWHFRDFSGRVGRSDLAGDFVLDRRRTPQLMRADLVSDRLDMKDLAGFVGAEPQPAAKPPSGRVLPHAPYSLEKLKAADADVRFSGRSILTEKLPLRDMTTHLKLAGGRLSLDPLDFGVAGGHIVSAITLDARHSPIGTTADVRVRELQLNQLVPDLQMTKASVGRIDGRALLDMRGDSVAAMLGSADGEVALLTEGGEISDRLLRLINLDIANTLLTFVRGDRNIAIRCMAGRLSAEDGVMTVRDFVLDTQHTNLTGTGALDFRDEALDLQLVARPKDNSLAALRGPIRIGGRFRDPTVRPDLLRLSARTGAAVLLGTVATPPAALLALVEIGGGRNADCAPRVADARSFIEAVAPPADRPE